MYVRVFFKRSRGSIPSEEKRFSIFMNLTPPNFWPCASWVCNTLGPLKRDPEEKKKKGYPLSQQEMLSLARAAEKRVAETKHHVQNKVTML